MVTHVAATSSGFAIDRSKDKIEKIGNLVFVLCHVLIKTIYSISVSALYMQYVFLHLQTLLHSECLRVVFDIDDVLPHSLGCLSSLWLGVHYL